MYDMPVVFHFKVEFGPNSHDGSGGFSEQKDNRFQEVSGLSAEITTEEFKEGGGGANFKSGLATIDHIKGFNNSSR